MIRVITDNYEEFRDFCQRYKLDPNRDALYCNQPSHVIGVPFGTEVVVLPFFSFAKSPMVFTSAAERGQIVCIEEHEWKENRLVHNDS